MQMFRRIMACVLVFLVLLSGAYAAGSNVFRDEHADFEPLHSKIVTEPKTVVRYSESLAELRVTEEECFHVAAPDKVYSLTNISEKTDCYLTVSIRKYTATTASEIRRRLQYEVTNLLELGKLPEGDATVYFASFAEVRYLTDDYSWVGDFSDGRESGVLHVKKGQTVSFSLPEAKEGDIFYISIEAYYQNESGDTEIAPSFVYVLISTDPVEPAPPTGSTAWYSEIPVYTQLESRQQKTNLMIKDSKPAQGSKLQIFKYNSIRVATPDQEYTLTNTEKYDITVSLLIFKIENVSTLQDRYSDFTRENFWNELLEGSDVVYYAEKNTNKVHFLTKDGTFRSGFLTDSDPSILRLRAGESVTFTLPEAKDGKLYRILIDPSEKLIYNYDILIDSTVESASIDHVFSDVSNMAYYAKPVNWAIKHGITTGTTETTFSPDATCTKAQILTFLWRANGQPAPAVSNPFTDVGEGDYFYQAALWAYEKGLVEGGVFNESQPCTRAMTVTYLWKLAGSPEAMPSSFSDVDKTAEYAAAVAWAVSEDITNGTSETTFSPDTTCTRAQIVTLLYRAIGG